MVSQLHLDSDIPLDHGRRWAESPWLEPGSPVKLSSQQQVYVPLEPIASLQFAMSWGSCSSEGGVWVQACAECPSHGVPTGGLKPLEQHHAQHAEALNEPRDEQMHSFPVPLAPVQVSSVLWAARLGVKELDGREERREPRSSLLPRC